jgi:predicted ATPase
LSSGEAEKRFRRTLDIARAQQARLFELRAATSLSKFRIAQDRTSEARDELQQVYGWFSEGFDCNGRERCSMTRRALPPITLSCG